MRPKVLLNILQLTIMIMTNHLYLKIFIQKILVELQILPQNRYKNKNWKILPLKKIIRYYRFVEAVLDENHPKNLRKHIIYPYSSCLLSIFKHFWQKIVEKIVKSQKTSLPFHSISIVDSLTLTYCYFKSSTLKLS